MDQVFCLLLLTLMWVVFLSCCSCVVVAVAVAVAVADVVIVAWWAEQPKV